MMQEVRLIYADALKEELSEFNYDMALRIVDKQQTIEAEQVRHGEWNDDHEQVVCSICKSEFDYEMLIFIANGIEAEYVDGMTCRCPKCGSYNRYGEPPESEVQSDDEC